MNSVTGRTVPDDGSRGWGEAIYAVTGGRGERSVVLSFWDHLNPSPLLCCSVIHKDSVHIITPYYILMSVPSTGVSVKGVAMRVQEQLITEGKSHRTWDCKKCATVLDRRFSILTNLANHSPPLPLSFPPQPPPTTSKKVSALPGLNQRPQDLQSNALPLS